MIPAPRVYIAASLLPRSASSSVKYSPARVRSAVDFRMPCGPSRIRQQSAFDPWPGDPGHGRDQPARGHGTRVFCLRCAKVGCQPTVQALNPVPTQALQVCFDRMEGPIPSGGPRRLPGDFDRAHNSLSLQPVRSQPVLKVGPFSFGYNAPGRWLHDHGAASEFIECQHSTPLRSVPECGNGVG